MEHDLDTYYERYAPMVHRRCVQLLGDEHDAMDAMQEVFVSLLGYRGRIAHPAAFLYRTTTHVCLNYIRASKRHDDKVHHARLLTIARYEEGGGALQARALLRRLMGQSSPSTQHIAVLHYVDGLTLEQVAGAVGLSVSGVRKRLRKLRQQLESLHEEARP